MLQVVEWKVFTVVLKNKLVKYLYTLFFLLFIFFLENSTGDIFYVYKCVDTYFNYRYHEWKTSLTKEITKRPLNFGDMYSDVLCKISKLALQLTKEEYQKQKERINIDASKVFNTVFGLPSPST